MNDQEISGRLHELHMPTYHDILSRKPEEAQP